MEYFAGADVAIGRESARGIEGEDIAGRVAEVTEGGFVVDEAGGATGCCSSNDMSEEDDEEPEGATVAAGAAATRARSTAICSESVR